MKASSTRQAAIAAQPEDILILTASTGAGHDTVAAALREAINDVAPEIRVHIVDALAGKGGRGPLSPGYWYDTAVEYAPWMWRAFYRATDAEWAVRLGIAGAGPFWAGRLRMTLRARRPGMVLSVHPIGTRLAAAVLRTVPDAPPLHCIVTDLVTVHRCWASDAVHRYYVATSDASDALVAAGVLPERIAVTGLPLRASFASPPPAPPKGDVARVLLLGGGHPPRRIERVARALADTDSPSDLVVVCGRNTRLQRRLARALDGRATVFGWRDDITDLMRWSSVVVTKAGPTTVAEALSQARPVVIYEALEGQETGNVVLAERSNSGCYAPDADALRQSVAGYLQACQAGDSAHAAWLGSAAQRVTEHVLGDLQASRPELPGAFLDHAETSGGPERVISNPISGERIVVRQSAEQTDGRLLAFDLYLPPGAHVPARHVHPSQEERFTVLEGRMRFRLGWRRAIIANSGDTVVVPMGTAHWFGNAGEGASHAHVEVRPALRLQEVFERSAAMEMVERFPGIRVPRVSDLALLMLEFQRELAVPNVPGFLVKAFLGPLAWLARHRSSAAARGSVG